MIESVEQAKVYLKNYPCVCPYGMSPYVCKDREGCEFSQAIRLICEEMKEGETNEKDTDII